MNGFFVTSSGTGIGKTLVTAALVTQLRDRGAPVRALKPVISGTDGIAAADTDSGLLLAALGENVTPEAVAAISPWRFAAPLSPDMAAAREGRSVDFAALVAFCREAARAEETLLIEGVGGVMVPLTTGETVADWIAALDIPAILVVGSYLGALSHALTAAAVLDAKGVDLAQLVVSESPDSAVSLDETVATLSNFLAPAPIVPLPRLAPGGRPWEAAPDLLATLTNRSSG